MLSTYSSPFVIGIDVLASGFNRSMQPVANRSCASVSLTPKLVFSSSRQRLRVRKEEARRSFEKPNTTGESRLGGSSVKYDQMLLSCEKSQPSCPVGVWPLSAFSEDPGTLLSLLLVANCAAAIESGVRP